MAQIAADLALKRAQQRLPPLGVTLQEDRVWEMVARHMILRHSLPAAVLDRNPRLATGLLEPDLYFGDLLRCKRRLAPSETEPRTRLPARDMADLIDLPARQGLGEAAAGPWLKGQRARRAGGKAEQPVWTPPCPDLADKDVECPDRRRRNTLRHQNARGHARSRCALNAASCKTHSRSVSSSHNFRSAIGFGRKA